MPRYIEPPPNIFESVSGAQGSSVNSHNGGIQKEPSLINWLFSVYQALVTLENMVVTTVTATSTLRPEQSGLILIANTGAISLNLPKAASVGEGFRYLFIKTTSDAQIATLDGNGSETINGSATNTQIDAQYDRIGIVSNGSNWLIFEREIA